MTMVRVHILYRESGTCRCFNVTVVRYMFSFVTGVRVHVFYCDSGTLHVQFCGRGTCTCFLL